MAEAVLDWPVILEAIKQHLVGVKNAALQPAFAQVFIGPPMAMPLGGPYAFAWYSARRDSLKAGGARATLGNVMYAAHIEIALYWPMQAMRETHQSWEADIATVDTNLRRAFRADSTINSNVTDIDILDSEDTTPFQRLPTPNENAPWPLYRTLELTLVLDNLEGEAIAA